MGLPVELRLQIYSSLLGGEPAAVGMRHHCCFVSGKIHRSLPPARTIKCDCASKTWPQILAANKSIFREAMPVLYNNLEMRIVLPDDNLGCGTSFQRGLSAIPHYGLDHVHNIVLVGSTMESTVKMHHIDAEFLDLRFDLIIKSLPNIKTLRLHYCTRLDHLSNDSLKSFDYHQLANIAGFPKLEVVKLDIGPSAACYTREYGAGSATFCGEVKNRMLAKAGSLDKKLSVVIDEAPKGEELQAPAGKKLESV